MAAPRKYPDELRERATRMAVELRQDPGTKQGAIARVAELLGMHPETLRNWVRQPRSTAALVPARRRATRSGWPSSSVRTASCGGPTTS
jgi:transposase